MLAPKSHIFFHLPIVSAVLLPALFLVSTAHGDAPTVDAEFLKTLPQEEQALKDTVDHWGLPFADQLRRFLAAGETFRVALGDKSPKGFIVGLQHGLEKVPQNKYWFKGEYGTRVSIEAAANEHENFQVAVLPDVGKRLEQVALAAGELRSENGKSVIPPSAVKVYRVAYVETVPAQYPSLYTGPWPDALLPNGPQEIGKTDLGLFWVDVDVPADSAPGVYRGQLTLTADGQTLAIDVSLRVYNFKLPDRVPFPITVWTLTTLPDGGKMSGDEYRALLAELRDHGIDPISVGKENVPADGNFEQYDAAIEFCLQRGLQLFELPSPGDNPQKLRPLVEHLREKGWIDKAIVYSNLDEPDRKQFVNRNVPYCAELNRLYPDLRVFLASEYHDGIDGGCNIWMSDLSSGRGAEFAAANRGRAVLWFYYCHLPIRIDFHRPLVQAPNMEIDSEAVEHRLAPWIAWKYASPGMFIWAGNNEWHKADVDRKDWQNRGWRLSPKRLSFPYAGIHNGNGYLIYPGPCPSIRMKVLRDGQEDYGYLMELASRAKNSNDANLKAAAKKYLDVPAAVLVDSHYFNRNPESLRKTRSEMAELIESLGGR